MPTHDALKLLKDDHEKVAKLLAKLTHTTERGTKTRAQLLDEIHTEIKAHTHVEQEIFYPAFKQAVHTKGDQRLYYEAKEEHHAVEKVLSDLMRTDPATAAFGGKAKVLEELVEHHKKEEEKEMFPRARDAMTKSELAELGARMEERKQQIDRGGAWNAPTHAHP